MAHGIVTPLPRIVGPADVVIAGSVIPAGVSNIFPCLVVMLIHKICRRSFLRERQSCTAIQKYFLNQLSSIRRDGYKKAPRT